jgi:hypothetical protein
MAVHRNATADQLSDARVGMICNDDHDVFGAVAELLRGDGCAVEFFEPGTSVPARALSRLDLLLNKKVDPHSFRALKRARERGIATWNGPKTMLLGARLVGYEALQAVGCRVPEVSLEPFADDHVAKTYWDWHFHPDPEFNGTGDVYQRYLPARPIDYKYYGVDTGAGIDVQVLRATSKLDGDKEYLNLIDPVPELATKTRRLMRLFGSQAIGIDFVEYDDAFWAVDVNAAMSLRDAEMEPALADSIRHCLTAEDAPRDRDVTGVEIPSVSRADGGHPT